MNSKSTLSVVGSITLCLVLSSCSSGEASQAPSDSLRIGRAYDVSTLDPALISAAGDVEIAGSLYSGLVRYKPGGTEIQPDLATDWESNKAGTRWTFTLRKDVQFHKDYGTVTSEDVVASLNRLIDSEFGSPRQVTMKAVEAIEADGPDRVTIALSEPDPDLLGKLASPFAGISSVAALKDKGDGFGQDPVGSGPFQFESFAPGQRLVFTAFPDYWEGQPALPRVEYLPIPDSTTLHAAFKTGDVDMVQVNDPTHYDEYAASATATLVETPLLQARFLQVGLHKPPFNDPLVREALSYAVDRESLVEGLFPGISVIADSPFPLGVNYRKDDVLHYEFDPDRARDLLAQAGHTDGLDVTFTVPQNPRFTDMATVVQADLKQSGISAEIEVMEPQSMLAEATTEEGLSLWTQSLTFAPNPDLALQTWFTSPGIPQTNTGRISDGELDRVVDDASGTIDEEERTKAFEKAQDLITAGHYTYFIDYEKYIWATKDYVKGLEASPLRVLDLDNVTLTSTP